MAFSPAGARPRAANSATMSQDPKPIPAERDIGQFELFLLRRGVGALEADRDRCGDCGRTPLVGEHVHLYASVQGVVCELCSSLRREHPVATELVRHSEHGHTVRLTRAA
jgi:hypothetical protein